MKDFYDEFLAVPEKGKLKEKVLMTRVAVMVLTTLLGLAALSFSAYAYFTYSVSSGTVALQAAWFEVQISVKDEQGEAVTVQNPQPGVHQVSLPAGTYQVSVGNVGTATTGFVVMSLKDCEQTYHIQQMTAQVKDASFQLVISAPSEVKFQCNWGTSSCYSTYTQTGVNTEQYVLEGETVTPVLKTLLLQPPVMEETTASTEAKEDPSADVTEETTLATVSAPDTAESH